MFPTKNMVNYMSEMSRLFARPESENAYSLSAQSPNSSTNNRSSSSTDSTSPESFPEISTYQPNTRRSSTPERRTIYNTPPPNTPILYDTPKPSDTQFLLRRQRPIVGRKILAAETPPYERVQMTPIIPEEELILWQDEPIPYNNIYINHTNVFYELFPENRQYELKTPVKTSPTPSDLSNVSPSFSSVSPNRSPMGPTHFHRSGSVSSSSRPGSSGYQEGQKLCTFCRKNGETPVVYMTHSVKEKVGNKFIVSCPILRSHVCSTCGASGDNAHTITYCPVLRRNNNGAPLQSTTITLKNTRIKSNGRRRF